MSELGSVDNTCFARVRGGHCAGAHQCVILDRAPGPRLLYGSELMSDLDDEAGIYLETHAKQLEDDLISITVDHVGSDGRRAAGAIGCCRCGGGPSDWHGHTSARLAVWPRLTVAHDVADLDVLESLQQQLACGVEVLAPMRLGGGAVA